MSDDARTDMYGRPCRVETVSQNSRCGTGFPWWIGRVHVGDAILRETRVHESADKARKAAEAWLAKYLETGSWTEATDWHERNYWGTASS